MAEWIKPSENDTVIVHLSDLHFGSWNQDECWANLRTFLLSEVKPALVLVTGDIVDSPDTKSYEKARVALDSLNVPYYVCPGNHDRHFKGNALRLVKWITGQGNTPAVFDREFGFHIVGPNNLTLENIGTGWDIGLLGVDSSAQADFFARGYINPQLFLKLKETIKTGDPDLVILLTHHHLQSIRELELAKQKNLRDLSNLTLMVNSGSFLEALTKAHVDIVLHGHEHAAHWGKYGSLEKGKGETSIIGAGSATGNSALEGCRLDRASFNVLVIGQDRSVTLNVLAYQSQSWRVREDMPLFNATDARRLRLLRRAGQLNSDLNGQVTKFIEFKRNRDVSVRWVFKNWRLDQKHFNYFVYNTTGRPANALLRVTLPNGKSFDFRFKLFKRHTKDHTWFIEGDFDQDCLNTLVNIEFSFTWLGGGLLTEEEMNVVREGSAPGLVRREGFEFGYVFAGGPVAFAQLQLALPPEFAPENIEVRVYDREDKPQPVEQRELQERVLVLGPGRYSLNVTYPVEDRWYVLAWKPVSKPQAVGSQTPFSSPACQAKGNALLQNFQQSLSEPFKQFARLSLYIPGNNGSAVRVGHLASQNVGAFAPPDNIVIRGDTSVIGQAFWGEAGWVEKRSDQAAQVHGFLADEEALIVLPVRFSLGWRNPSPWAVVRIGVTSAQEAKNLPPPEGWDAKFGPAIARLLTAAFE